MEVLVFPHEDRSIPEIYMYFNIEERFDRRDCDWVYIYWELMRDVFNLTRVLNNVVFARVVSVRILPCIGMVRTLSSQWFLAPAGLYALKWAY
jgi:hypothetical protein